MFVNKKFECPDLICVYLLKEYGFILHYLMIMQSDRGFLRCSQPSRIILIMVMISHAVLPEGLKVTCIQRGLVHKVLETFISVDFDDYGFEQMKNSQNITFEYYMEPIPFL